LSKGLAGKKGKKLVSSIETLKIKFPTYGKLLHVPTKVGRLLKNDLVINNVINNLFVDFSNFVKIGLKLTCLVGSTQRINKTFRDWLLNI
jgi:hypothetical protein